MEGAAEPEDFPFLDEDFYLQEMAEDEDIDLYNEETFGLDIETAGDLTDELYLLCEALETRSPELDLPPLSGDEVLPDSPASEPAPGKDAKGEGEPRPVERAERPQGEGVREKREWKILDEALGGLDETLAAQELEDPAVMKAFHGKPTLESLDSAIVDSGICSSWEGLSISQVLDRAIQRVIERTPMFDPLHSPLEFAPSPIPRGYPRSPGVKRPILGPHAMSPCHQLLQMPTGHGPPMPFRPMSPNVMGSKMMQMRFGSPAPNTSFYSPSANFLESFRFPGHVTQLHPQHRRLLKQRQQQMRSQSKKEGEERLDGYGSLMTKEEKAWIIKLQMIQLQSENPHLDDYYYQEFFRKLELKLADEELGERIKREPQKLVTPYVQKTENYEAVLRIAGSLGQVAVSTCYSPRRAIDAVHVETPEEDMTAFGRQRLRLLNAIEKMYMMLLEVEEIEGKLTVAGDDQRTRLCEKRERKVKWLYESLKVTERETDEEDSDFSQILNIRKGKKLVSRLLPILRPANGLEVVLSIAAHLPYLVLKDTDETLPLLFGPLTIIIGGLSFTEMIEVLQEVTTQLPGSTESSLRPVFQNKFSISFLYALLSHGEQLLSLDSPMEPCIGDFEIWTDTIFLVAKQLSQAPKSSVAEPLSLPSNLLSLFCRYVDKQTVHKLEDKIESSVSSPYPAIPS